MSSNGKRHNRQWILGMIIVFSVVLLALFVTAVVVLHNRNTDDAQLKGQSSISLELRGESVIVLEYGDAFEDPGAVGVRVQGETQYPLEVQTDSNLDLEKLGEYTITYTVSYNGEQLEKQRKVRIVDTQCPVIELVSNPDSFTAIGEKYLEEGFTAVDNYDGDITNNVQRIESDDGSSITYRVTDTSGNQAEVVRNIVYIDKDAPMLSLKGDATVTITAGNKWTEPGYTATDAVDGDLTSKVVVTGKVDYYVAGTYTVTYQVTDSGGNTTSKQRVVVVKAVQKPQPSEPDGEGKVIYLTFDDGPGVHTERLLGILGKYDVKATFFVCNTGYLELLDDIAQEGHSIGIHSKTHKYSQIYAGSDAFFSDFYAMRDLIVKYAGVEPTISRFPGGSSNRVSKQYCSGIMTRLTKAVQDLGYQYFDWNIDSNDAGGTKTADGVFYNVTSRIAESKNTHFVVLQHDIHGYSVDAVERIILWGLEHGYTFAALEVTSPVCHHGVVN